MDQRRPIREWRTGVAGRDSSCLKFLLGSAKGIPRVLRGFQLHETQGELHDKILASRRYRDLADGAHDGAATRLEPRSSRSERLLRNAGRRKSPQQVLRLHRLEQMARARRLGQFS